MRSRRPTRRGRAPMWHGVFSAAGSVRVATWNARALLHGLPATRRRKVGFLRGVMAQCDAMALQEVHVNAEALRIELAPLLGTWVVAMSGHADIASGGTAVLLRRAAFVDDAEITSTELNKGWILMVKIAKGEAATTIVALHH